MANAEVTWETETATKLQFLSRFIDLQLRNMLMNASIRWSPPFEKIGTVVGSCSVSDIILGGYPA